MVWSWALRASAHTVGKLYPLKPRAASVGLYLSVKRGRCYRWDCEPPWKWVSLALSDSGTNVKRIVRVVSYLLFAFVFTVFLCSRKSRLFHALNTTTVLSGHSSITATKSLLNHFTLLFFFFIPQKSTKLEAQKSRGKKNKKIIHVGGLNHTFNLTGRHKKSVPYYKDRSARWHTHTHTRARTLCEDKDHFE